MRNDFAVLVLSCDGSSDLWRPFLSQFHRHFPSNDTRIYVGANSIACQEPGIVPILSGEDKNWSWSYKRILEQIEERKLAIFVDDLLLASQVDTECLLNTVEFCFTSDAKHVKYWPNPSPSNRRHYPGIDQCTHGIPYRATVCGFWDREYLMSLLLEGENPWNFEILGSYRASYVDGFFELNTPLFTFKHMVEKGRWLPQSVEWAMNEGVMLDIDKRPMLKGRSQINSRLKMAYFHMMLKVPWQKRVRWMNTLRRALISY